ncbi:hypothetical protein HKCCE2091_16705 [Rhodobacterales bacterium HKCCE2091]|nr:hypothetical protein [Rhodobacterales bacterium HKCCE2091]
MTRIEQPNEARSHVAGDLTGHVARYILSRRYESWSADAVEKIRVHLYDTLLAIVSGHDLPAGKHAATYVEEYGTTDRPGGRVLGTDATLPPEVAAMVNGTLAHADETDDTSELARMHPGASIIPAALAVAGPAGATGREVLNAILTGYQVGIAFPLAIWAEPHERMHCSRTSHNAGQVMGAVAAAGVLMGLDETRMRYALSYAAQQSSGINSLYRDSHHVEKAYVFGGLPAAQGVQAATLARLGFTGVVDILDRSVNLFDSYEGRSNPAALPGLLEDPAGGVFAADIKLYPVGLPIQAAAQAMGQLLAQSPIDPSKIASVTCHLPSQKAFVVDDRDMPAICLQYILAAMIEDGGLTFENSHDQIRLNHSRGTGLMSRVALVHDAALDPVERTGSRNRAVVRITFNDGSEQVARVDALSGTRFAPATWDDMERKTTMVFGRNHATRLNPLRERVLGFESVEFAQDGAAPFYEALILGRNP